MGPRTTELDSGLTVVTEAMPGVESVALGLYFPTGSRHESPDNNGISHFIEHLVFKGTKKRSADQINREIDLLGGGSNAYTTKESVCFHARVLSEHLPRIVEFFADLAVGALPPGLEAEVEQEREVILSEISAIDDSPEDLVGDLIDRAYFGDHPLALPIVGSARAVGRLGLSEIRTHFKRHLVSHGMVAAAAGKLDHAHLVDLLEQHLDALPSGGPRALQPAPVAGRETHCVERDLEQVQICLSARGITRGDSRRAAADLLSAIVGDGYSSRLFREVRDRRGLAYSIYSSLSSYVDAGSFNIYLGVAPEKLEQAFEVVGRVLAEIRDGGIGADELAAAKLHLRGSTLLAHEFTGTRMGFLAEKALLGDSRLELAHDLAQLESATLEDLHALASELFGAPLALAAVGPVGSERLPPDGWELPG